MRAPNRMTRWLQLSVLTALVAAPLIAGAQPSITIHDPFFEPGRFTTRNLQLEGRGNNLVVPRGGRIDATLEIFHRCPDCRGGAQNQIVVSLAGDRDAQACVWSGGDRSKGWETTRFALDVPDVPGVYEVRARYAQARSCRDAGRWWRTDRTDGPTGDSTIGLVIVEGDPEPVRVERPLRAIRADLDQALTALDDTTAKLVELTDKRLDGKRQNRVFQLSGEAARLAATLRVLDEELADAVRRELHERRGDRRDDDRPAPRPPRFERPRVVIVAAPVPDAGPRPMTPAEFTTLMRRVEDATFADAQLNALRDALRADTFFLTAQALGVLGLFAHDTDKVDAAALMCPNIIEPRPLPDLLAAFTFESYRDELRKKTRNTCGYSR